MPFRNRRDRGLIMSLAGSCTMKDQALTRKNQQQQQDEIDAKDQWSLAQKCWSAKLYGLGMLVHNSAMALRKKAGLGGNDEDVF